MSALQNEIDKLKTLQESFNELSSKVLDTQAVLTELDNGKKNIAAAITRKGVKTNESDSFNKMVDNINAISQNSFNISESIYPKTIYSGNLHDIIKESLYILSSGNFVGYGGFVLARYYKDEDSIILEGASAYICSDNKDTLFTESYVEHIWDDKNDGMLDRYVAYLYRDLNYQASFTSNSVHPKDIVVIGNCRSLNIDYNFLNHIYCPQIEGYVNSIGEINIGDNNYKGEWGQIQVIEGLTSIASGSIFKSVSEIIFASFPDLINVSNIGHLFLGKVEAGVDCNIHYISLPSLKSFSSSLLYQEGYAGNSFNSLIAIDMPELETCSSSILGWEKLYSGTSSFLNSLITINAPKLKSCTADNFIGSLYGTRGTGDGGLNKLKKIYIPSCNSIKNIVVGHNSKSILAPELIDVEVGEMNVNLNLSFWWATSIVASNIKTLEMLDNVKKHIALKVSDRTGLSPLTVTFGFYSAVSNYSNGTEEENSLIQAAWTEIVDIFAAKNWIVAGV